MKNIILITVVIFLSSNIFAQTYFNKTFPSKTIKEKKIKEINVYYQNVAVFDDTTIILYEKKKIYRRFYNKDYMISYEIFFRDYERFYYWSKNNDTALVKSISFKAPPKFNTDSFYIDNKGRNIITFTLSRNLEKHYAYNEINKSIRTDFFDTKNRNSLIKKEYYRDEEKDSIIITEHKVYNINDPWKVCFSKLWNNSFVHNYSEKNNYIVDIRAGRVEISEFFTNEKLLLKRFSYHEIVEDQNHCIEYNNYFYEYKYRE